ncbi:MAG: type II toxin-antitoxin system VapC family toxin [Syntrophobacterales bacterium]|nr:type II toxin-antitoxin system VapC family toxin [Syntrophobacterales bacterium]
MIWIVDASVTVKWFLAEERNSPADAVLERWIDQPEFFAIPELFCFEVFSVLCRIHPRGREVFVEGVLPMIQGGVLRQPMTEQLASDAANFVADGLTGYDACYAALARQLGGIWLTFDARAHRLIASEAISHNLAEGLPAGWL